MTSNVNFHPTHRGQPAAMPMFHAIHHGMPEKPMVTGISPEELREHIEKAKEMGHGLLSFIGQDASSYIKTALDFYSGFKKADPGYQNRIKELHAQSLAQDGPQLASLKTLARIGGLLLGSSVVAGAKLSAFTWAFGISLVLSSLATLDPKNNWEEWIRLGSVAAATKVAFFPSLFGSALIAFALDDRGYLDMGGQLPTSTHAANVGIAAFKALLEQLNILSEEIVAEQV